MMARIKVRALMPFVVFVSFSGVGLVLGIYTLRGLLRSVSGVSDAVVAPEQGSSLPAPTANLASGNVPQPTVSPHLQRSYIGVHTVTLDEYVVERINSHPESSLNLSESVGLLVVKVESNSPAAAAGVQIGDVIRKAGGREIKFRSSLTEVLLGIGNGHDAYKRGDPINFQILRGRDFLSTTISVSVIDERYFPEASTYDDPAINAFLTPPALPQNTDYGIGTAITNPSEVGGMVTTELRELGLSSDEMSQVSAVVRNFSQSEATGALILAIRPGSPAQWSALLPGDIIQVMAEKPIQSAADVAEIVRSSGGQKLTVEFLREGTTYSTEVIPEVLPARLGQSAAAEREEELRIIRDSFAIF